MPMLYQLVSYVQWAYVQWVVPLGRKTIGINAWT